MLIDHGRIGRGIYFWTERVVFSCEESEMIWAQLKLVRDSSDRARVAFILETSVEIRIRKDGIYLWLNILISLSFCEQQLFLNKIEHINLINYT